MWSKHNYASEIIMGFEKISATTGVKTMACFQYRGQILVITFDERNFYGLSWLTSSWFINKGCKECSFLKWYFSFPWVYSGLIIRRAKVIILLRDPENRYGWQEIQHKPDHELTVRNFRCPFVKTSNATPLKVREKSNRFFRSPLL